MRSSYPYLNVARAYNQPYWLVLRYLEHLEALYRGENSGWTLGGFAIKLDDTQAWCLATWDAFLVERTRQLEVRTQAEFLEEHRLAIDPVPELKDGW